MGRQAPRLKELQGSSLKGPGVARLSCPEQPWELPMVHSVLVEVCSPLPWTMKGLDISPVSTILHSPPQCLRSPLLHVLQQPHLVLWIVTP